MNMNKRRLEVLSDASSLGVLDQITVQDQTDVANFHGMRFCASIEPEDGGANANGFWAVWCLLADQIQLADLPNTVGEFNDEEQHSAYLWGIGCWTTSNEAPYHLEFAPNTSRTCKKGARLVFRIFKSGISAGNVRINMVTTGFTSS